MKVSRHRIIGIVLFIAIILLLYFVKELVVYFLVSMILTLVLRPVVNRLKKIKIKNWHVPNWLAALAAMVIMFTFFIQLFRLFLPLIADEIQILKAVNIEERYQALQGPLKAINEFLNTNDIQFEKGMSNDEYIRNQIISIFDVSKVTALFSSIVTGLGNFVYSTFVISFITFFLLKDNYILENSMDALVPDAYLEKIKKIARSANKTLSRYFIGLLIQVTLITTCNSIGLSVLGVHNALVIALFTGLINVIPYIGPLIGSSFGLLIIMTTSLDLPPDDFMSLGLYTCVVFGITQVLDNFVFQPIIFGKSINAHPLEIFIVIMIGASLGGITGMIIAVPTFSFVRIVAHEFLGEFKWIQTMTRNVE